jgi:subtilisin
VAPKWCGDNPDHPACSDDDEDDGGDGSDPQTLPWGVDRIDADNNTNTGGSSHVYVLDTGIDMDHPDLQANIGESVNCLNSSGGPPWSRTYTCESGGDDDNGHGTHVAGTIAAIDNDIDVVGVAPEATLHAVKVLDKNGSGYTSSIIAGIDWVAGQVGGSAVAANMSLGGSGSKSGSCSDAGFTGSDSFHEAMCNATNAGVVFAVAAGNDGADAENTVPAAYDDAAMAVSATNDSDDWRSWSNWGDDAASWTGNDSAPVAIAAPGVDILSTWNDGGTRTISGTSMASPHVAGAIALHLHSNPQSPDYSAFENSRSTVLGTAEDSGGFSNTSGNPHAEDFLDASGL